MGEVPATEENFAMKANSTAGSHGRNGCRDGPEFRRGHVDYGASRTRCARRRSEPADRGSGAGASRCTRPPSGDHQVTFEARECPADRRTGVPLRPMRARRPEARFAMLSTAWSRTDPFWMVWAGDDPSWIRLKATADTVHYDPKFLEQERRSLGEDAFKREYFGVPLGAQTSPFTWEL
jgi:hypothetical protein